MVEADRPLTLVTVQQSRESVTQLRHLFRNELAEYRSPELHAAVDNVLHTKADVLAILLTGGGKSLLFLLYATLHTNIVPTIALKSDLMRRTRDHGIPCTDNPAANVSCERIISVTPEAATGEVLRSQLMKLYCSKRLGSIFIDEAHLFSMQTQFRPTFRQLPEIKFLPVPIVLLTATAPN